MFLSDIFEECIAGPWETAGYDVQYRIKKYDDVVEIYFQGTASKEDWKIDFDTWVIPYSNMPVRWVGHRGFITAYKSVRGIIQEAVKGAKHVFISGHSLGAALATACLEDITFTYPEKDSGAIVFGAPRLFWLPPLSVRRRMQNLLRVQNFGDIVGHVPPALVGFCHVGFKRKIGTLERFIENLFTIKYLTDAPTLRSHQFDEYRYALKGEYGED